jgi:uncharacterized membrane protein
MSKRAEWIYLTINILWFLFTLFCVTTHYFDSIRILAFIIPAAGFLVLNRIMIYHVKKSKRKNNAPQ